MEAIIIAAALGVSAFASWREHRARSERDRLAEELHRAKHKLGAGGRAAGANKRARRAELEALQRERLDQLVRETAQRRLPMEPSNG